MYLVTIFKSLFCLFSPAFMLDEISQMAQLFGPNIKLESASD